MWYLCLSAFLLLGGYFLLMALRFGIPNMVSDTYYQLQGCTGSEIVPFREPRNMGWIFSLLMVTVSFLMLICLLDTGRGIQFLAFLGCAGLCFVGCAPNYCDHDAYSVHKTSAIIAAVGSIGWCMSVSILPTLVILTAYLSYVYQSRRAKTRHPWYWAEVSGFADVFLTYIIMYSQGSL